MRLATSFPLSLLSLALCLATPALAAAEPIKLEVRSEGFVPSEIKVKAGEPVELLVTRTTDRTCATEIVIEGQGVRRALPLGKPVSVSFTPARPGRLRYACAMNMVAGVLLVE
jgi:plastocyanin domain-containing protein